MVRNVVNNGNRIVFFLMKLSLMVDIIERSIGELR